MKTTFLAALAALALTAAAARADDTTPTPTTPVEPKYDWGVAYYMSYDNNLEGCGQPIIDMIRKGSGIL